MPRRAAIIVDYEWLGIMPAVVSHCFGIFFAGRLGGAVVYGPDYGENLGVWDRYGFTGKIIALKRGACVHWAHPHAASKLIRRSMDLLPARYQVVTATVDAAAGEIGTIYQACGFHYVGVMSKGAARAHPPPRRHHPVGAQRPQEVRHRAAGRRSPPTGIDAKPVARRARYFAFRGTRREQQRLLAAIAHLLQPYPRRRLQEPPERVELLGHHPILQSAPVRLPVAWRITCSTP